jgi:hypothetical protein
MDTTDAASFLSHAEEPSIPDDTNAQHGTAQYCTLQSFFLSKLAAETKQQQNLKGKTKESPMPLSRRKIHVCESHKKTNAKGKIQDH